jgi:hypothetical protein
MKTVICQISYRNQLKYFFHNIGYQSVSKIILDCHRFVPSGLLIHMYIITYRFEEQTIFKYIFYTYVDGAAIYITFYNDFWFNSNFPYKSTNDQYISKSKKILSFEYL